MALKRKVQQSSITTVVTDSDDDLATSSANVERSNATGSAQGAKKMGAKRKVPATKPRAVLQDRTNIPACQASDEQGNGLKKPKAKRSKLDLPHHAVQSRPGVLEVIPESQPEPTCEEVEQSIEIEGAFASRTNPAIKDRQDSVLSHRAGSASVAPDRARYNTTARAASVQPVTSRYLERSKSTAPEDRFARGNDVELRQRLADMTKKYEDTNARCRELEDCGKSQAESNFEKLKIDTDQRIKDANSLIAALKKELSEIRRSNGNHDSELSALHKQVTKLNGTNENLTSENARLKLEVKTVRDEDKAQLVSVREKLTIARNENKGLEVKLLAAREQAARMPEVKLSERTVDRATGGNLLDAQREARMKENLYADLTGLIIRGVKRKDGEDEYDCLQTGRNGALHFHLSIANDSAVSNPKTPSGLSYEDAEFAYEPFLDEGRDRELISILPDYLTEEICFPRCHAVKFYGKVVECMTQKIVTEDE